MMLGIVRTSFSADEVIFFLFSSVIVKSLPRRDSKNREVGEIPKSMIKCCLRLNMRREDVVEFKMKL